MKDNAHTFEHSDTYALAALATLALRLVIGWTYFSAFLRRVVLENKLDPDVAGYVGEKFNHFLPNALGIKPLIAYLVTHPDTLFWAMVLFTCIEGIVGLAIMLGFFTRLMSLGVMGLAGGILLGSGWLGTTCLDEWQIGILGVAGGFALGVAGGGFYSADYWIRNKFPAIRRKPWFVWMASGELPCRARPLCRWVAALSVAIFALALYTNQYFHGGVWGPLHNKSVKPGIELADVRLENGRLSFDIYRVEGVDVYGSFLIGITLKDAQGTIRFNRTGDELKDFPTSAIANVYVAKVKPGAHSLVVPLGAKARLRLEDPALQQLPEGKYTLVLTDISGATWQQEVEWRG